LCSNVQNAYGNFVNPEQITIAQLPDHRRVIGDFVDGGVSPFNNPTLQAFFYATLAGYRINWPAGEDNILVVSVGTGAADPAVRRIAPATKIFIAFLLDEVSATTTGG
jgi:hypothetical protein